ncbi:heme oxygenase [Micrococcales bacterium KH10]|nr:heme oxygenase [Micrococcales bacterium KH10]
MTSSSLASPHAPLSQQLRHGTRQAHETAETTGFITRLMSGELSVAAYADLAAQQYPIYRALEEVSEALRSDERGATLVFDELTRTPSIEADLAFLFGPQWSEEIDILPQTTAYADRIREIGGDLAAYAAHAYTRYLGDLSGGQIIQRMMQRHYEMGAEGLTFYDFDEIPKAKPFKDVYRERLDALPLTEDEQAAAVAEAQHAFALNTELFAALGARHS